MMTNSTLKYALIFFSGLLVLPTFGQRIDSHIHLYDTDREGSSTFLDPKKHEKIYFPHFAKTFIDTAGPAGIDFAVVVEASRRREDNFWLMQHVDTSDATLAFIANLDPRDPDFVADLDSLSTYKKFRGIRIRPATPINLADSSILASFAHLARKNLVLELRAGGVDPRTISSIARRYPTMNIIMNHMAGGRMDGDQIKPSDWLDRLAEFASEPNVYCKISMLYNLSGKNPAPKDAAYYKPFIDPVVDAFGTDRVIFGSNWTLSDMLGTYGDMIAMYDAYLATREDLRPEQLFFENINRAYGINQETYFAADWVATDALGRKLPTYEEAGPRRKGKLVGMFYFIWHGSHGDSIWDLTKILAENPEDPPWGPKNSYHFWGEPEQGYHNSEDPWVIRRDLQMLSNADIDFLFFDVTNARAYVQVVEEVCKVALQMRAEGIRTPDLCFLTNTRSGRVMNQVYDELYSRKEYEELWFTWEGKPLIMGKKEDPELRKEVRDFFTIRKSWAWTNTREEANHWQWLDSYPQDYGWSKSPDIPEQITVSTAHHPQNPLGKSFHDGVQPPVLEDYTTEFTDQGLQFEEQWSRAHQVDPQVVMVTQWNEWIAGRFQWKQEDGYYAGKPIKQGEWRHFVDVFSREFNRDIAPMKDGYTDSYYYQLVGHVRRFKGMDPPQMPSAPFRASMDGSFQEWRGVSPVFYDPPGDTKHRDFRAYDPDIQYVNRSGRNDIIESRVTHDQGRLYFYVKTRAELSSCTDPNWMLLFLDTDKDSRTGWEGYDYVINHGEIRQGSSTLKKWNGHAWEHTGNVDFATGGNELELAVSRQILGMTGASPDVYFHWADHPQHLLDISDFFLNGDSAPDRRFNYHYKNPIDD